MKRFYLSLVLLMLISVGVVNSQTTKNLKQIDPTRQSVDNKNVIISSFIDINKTKKSIDKSKTQTTFNDLSISQNKSFRSPKGTVWNDDFETDKGWTLTGEWERGTPVALGGEHGNPDPGAAFQGNNVLGTDLTGLGANPGDYEASLGDRAYLATSPVINCGSYTNVTIEFQRWLNVESPSYDHAYIDVFDGFVWHQVWTNLGTMSDAAWSLQSIDVSAYADGNSNFRVRFAIGSTDGSWFYSGWNLDEFSVNGDLSGENTISAGAISEPATISSLWDTEGEAVINFDFTVTDDGSVPATDALNTLFSSLLITQGVGNDIVDWTEAIAGATISDGTNTVYGIVGASDISFSGITFNVGDLGYIADNGSKTYTLKIWLNSSMGGATPTTIDGSNLVFEVTNTSFGIEPGSSGFAIGETENSGATNNEVVVVASQLIFSGQPSSSATSTVALVLQPILRATDANGNTDEDINSVVTLSNSGTLLIANNSMSFSNGVADFAGSGFMFTTGGEYVTLSAVSGALSSIFPSTEIAVDITGCEFFAEDFNLISTKRDLNGEGDWFYTELTNSSNDWGIATRAGNGNCLTIYNNSAAYQYNNGNDGDEIAYYNVQIDATGYRDVTIEFDWQCEGEAGYDYGQIMWSTDGTNWSIANQNYFVSQNAWTTGTYDLSVVDDQQFYIGFRWQNDGSVGTNPPFAVDNISIKGIPNFKYNFSYRDDLFESITGTVVIPDGNDGANISLPAGFDFKYDGVAVNNVRANVNGWLEMGTSHGTNAENNFLTSVSEVPFLAPLWDDLVADGQTRIIYTVSGNTPTRIFTVEWLDVLWGGQRQNFQVKLYETSYVIEFWYGQMHNPGGASASIGINNSGTCMNKIISVSPGVTPSASYNAENNSINSSTYLTEGLVYIFNPLSMQSYKSWQSATLLIGQSDWDQQNTTLDQSTIRAPSSAAISAKNVLVVGQQGLGLTPPMTEGRILIWNAVPAANGANADVVLGKSDFTDDVGGCTADRVNSINGVCFSPDGEKIIGVDYGNNRVLIWNSIPTVNGTAADVVVGQPDFVTNSTGTSASKMNGPLDAYVLPDGKLVVSDAGNNRVLIWNEIPTVNGTDADVVIGQPDFTSNAAGNGTNGLSGPWGLSYSPEGQLFIVDRLNERILVYNDVPSANGAAADQVIGQTDFVTTTTGTGKSKFYRPLGVTISPESKMAVCEFFNHRTMVYNQIPASNGGAANHVLGQPYFDENYTFNDGYSQMDLTTSDDRNMQYAYATRFDLNGRLLVVGRDMRRVMMYGETPTETSDLEVNIVSDLPEVCVYNDVEYSVEIVNHGADDAYNVVVNAQLPTGLIHVNYNAQDGSTYNQKSGYWRIPYISNGDTARLVFSGEVQPILAGDNNVVAYANTIASSQKDDDYSNNADNAIIAIRNFYAPTISEIDDQYIPRNGSVLVNFTVDDDDGLADISTYTATSSVTSLIPLDYVSNIVFAGAEPNKTVTLTPAADMYGYTEMSVIVTDIHGCFNEEPFLVTVGNIWEGDDIKNDPTQWDAAENWSFAIPNATLEAIIPTKPIGGYFPIIDINGASCEDLFIEPKASVTINDTYGLTIFGKAYLQSDVSGTGSLVDLSVGESKVVNHDSIFVERYLTPDAWHYISSPIDIAPNTVLTEDNCGTSYNGNLLDYNEAYSTDYDGDGDIDWFDGWEWPWYYTHNSDILEPANGYAYYSYGTCDNIAVFTEDSDAFNTGTYNVTVTNQDDSYAPTGFGPHRGWNLVGNPYPSGLDAEDFLNANSGVIDGTVYFWDENGLMGFDLEGADYASYNPTLGATTGAGAGTTTPDKYISIGQGFFVHKTSSTPTSGTITFTNAMRETENSSFFAPVVEVQKLKLSLSHENLYNEIIIGLLPDATFDFDPAYDGYKVEGNQNFAFYSLIGSEHFVNQGIPTIINDQQYSVNLGFNAQNVGEYTVDLKYIENISDDVKILLEDTYNDEIIDVRKNNSFSFDVSQAGRYEDRFILHFNMNSSPVVVTPVDNIITKEDEELFVYIPEYYFNDPDNDELTFTLSLEDGSDIPTWMNFDADQLLITAFPANENVGKYKLMITATDNSGASVSDVFELEVLNVNDAPELINPLADIEINSLEQFAFIIPENSFVDIDLNDNLRYEAYLDNNKPLPNWLEFDARNRSFSGIAAISDAGDYEITVKVFDNSNEFAYDEFILDVNSTTNLNSDVNEFNVYPNPSDGKFVIENSNANYTFKITDALGKVIFEGTSNTNRKQVDLKVAPGVYTLNVFYSNNTSETKSITIIK